MKKNFIVLVLFLLFSQLGYSQRLHLLISSSEDNGIGTQTDSKNVKNLANEIQENIEELKVKIYYVSEEEFSKTWIENIIYSINGDISNDVIWVYHTGEGQNYDQWPQTDTHEVPLTWIHNLLSSTDARLTISQYETCSYLDPIAVNDIPQNISSNTSTYSFSTLKKSNLKSNLYNLFLFSRGNIILSACSSTQVSYGSYAAGGLFTNAFIDAVKEKMDWHEVLRRTKDLTSKAAQSINKIQTPQYDHKSIDYSYAFPNPDNNPNLHLIISGHSDLEISSEMDVKNIENFIHQIQHRLPNLNIKIYKIGEEEFSKKWISTTLRSLGGDLDNDIIWVYHSGHGRNYDTWPSTSNHEVPLTWVHEKLKGTKARLTIAIYEATTFMMALNKDPFLNKNPFIPELPIKNKPLHNLDNLFLKSKGNIILSSSQSTQYSHSLLDKAGYFTSFFLLSLLEQNRWDNVLRATQNFTTERANFNGKTQKPRYVWENAGYVQAKDIKTENKDVTPKTWALSIGIGTYQNAYKLSTLEFPVDQGNKFARILENYDFTDNQEIPVLANGKATRDKIVKEMENTFCNKDKVSQEDLIIFYYSGHGETYGENIGICPYDYYNEKDLLSDKEIIEILNRSPAKHKICIIEACKNTAKKMGRGLTPQQKERFNQQRKNIEGGIIFFTSCEVGKESFEHREKGGFFSHYLLRGLKGEADADSNKTITIKELYDYVSSNVRRDTNFEQDPQINIGGFDWNTPVIALPE